MAESVDSAFAPLKKAEPGADLPAGMLNELLSDIFSAGQVQFFRDGHEFRGSLADLYFDEQNQLLVMMMWWLARKTVDSAKRTHWSDYGRFDMSHLAMGIKTDPKTISDAFICAGIKSQIFMIHCALSNSAFVFYPDGHQGNLAPSQIKGLLILEDYSEQEVPLESIDEF